MKKKILFVLALAVVLSACKMKLSENTGTVVIDFGSTERAVGSNGLPSIKDAAMSLEINSPSAGRQIVNFSSGEEKKWSGNFPVGEIISIKVTLSTDFAKWKGSSEHSVIAGSSRINIKLSKAPKSVGNILIDVNNTGDEVTLKPASAGQSLTGIAVSARDKLYPKIARDGIGRVYVLYKDTSTPSASYFKRFDVEGNLDTGFETALTSALTAAGVNIKFVDNMAIDPENNYIFLFRNQTVYCFKEKKDNSFESFGHAVFPSGAASLKVTAAAAYDDVLFVVDGAMLYACEFEFEDALGHAGAKCLKFESQASRNPLNKLRAKPAFGNNLTECIGLFADEDNVYCLLKEQELHYGKLYALGQLVHYTYSGSTLTGETKIGLNPAASSEDPIAFDAQYFSNPVGFIGYDEENLYIADDGYNIEYLNENWRINGNKNRIAVFHRETDSLSFSDSGATWYEEKPEYKLPNTKILLWEKQSPATALSPMNYWTSETGTDIRPSNLLFQDSTSPTIEPTDVFCYDQDGNLYILWKDSSNYNVRRFALKEDGTYDKAAAVTTDENLDIGGTVHPVSAIAVDISGGENYLYYVYEDGSNKHIQRRSWNSTSFNTATLDSTYGVHSSSVGISFTALAANKDGLFVGTRTMSIAPAGYTLSVKKYAKQDGADKGTIDVGAFQPTPTEPGSPYPPYTKTISAINALQVFDGVLYAVTSKEEYGMKKTSSAYRADTFKNSGKLYKIGSTKDGFSGSAVELAKKDPVDTAGNEVGYGFHRFIAVKYDESERIRLIIASDGAWGKEGLASSPDQPYCKNADKVLEYDLKGSLQAERDSGGGFSKLLQESGFEWN